MIMPTELSAHVALPDGLRFTSILVPLDGSPSSEHALPLAVRVARQTGAALHLAHVRIPPSVPMFTADLPLFDATLDDRAREQERVYLDTIIARLRSEPALCADSALLEGAISDSVADLISAHVRVTAADLVIMTTHGRGGLARLWLGSVADELVRRIHTPVLLLRPGEGVPAPDAEAVFRKILIPLDGSATAEQILEYVLALGGSTETDYTLLRVVEPVMLVRHIPADPAVKELDQQLLDQLLVEAQIYLEQVAERLTARGLKVRTRIVAVPQAAVAILGEACEDKAELIAMATHGRRGLARLLVGSVADKVLRGATTPMLLYRPWTHNEKAGADGAALR